MTNQTAVATEPVQAAQRVATRPVDVSIIIVNWKSKDYVRECLRTIDRDGHRSSYEVIVIDNASEDGCGDMLREEFPQVHAIESRENLGFAGANNLAFARSRGRQILFLNPDTEICGEAILRLSAALDALPDAGMVGAHLLNSDGTVQTTCVTALPSILNQILSSKYLRETFPAWKLWGMRPLFLESKNPAQVEAISGACMMARREILERIGCFSTDYFMYSEDMDLCMKVSKTGKKIYYIPDAVIVHHGGGSSSQREENNFSSIAQRESLIHFLEQHRGRIYAAAFRGCTAVACAFRLGLLAVATPMAFSPKGYRRIRRAVTKWASILQWSVGLNRWVRTPRRAEQA